jgi:hypothetical protein
MQQNKPTGTILLETMYSPMVPEDNINTLINEL